MEIEVKYFAEGMDPLCYVAGKSDWIDLHTAETVSLTAGEYRLIPLGVAIALPDGWEALVVPRSSTFQTWGLLQANSVGVIDHTYRGDGDQWYFPAYATRDVTIEKNSRVCQFRIQQNQPRLQFRMVEHLSHPDRGGFGTTGQGTVSARIVLASKSPRRRQLLEQMGIGSFRVVSPEADETPPTGVSFDKVVETLSARKAAAAACDPTEICIAADTLVVLDDRLLGKPRDESEALDMLMSLQGRWHTVCTGVTVRCGDRSETRSQRTEVQFRSAAEEELRAYIATGEPMDKAGAYGIQGRGALLVAGIEGDYSNVMGLPVCLLGEMLKDFGVSLLGEDAE